MRLLCRFGGPVRTLRPCIHLVLTSDWITSGQTRQITLYNWYSNVSRVYSFGNTLEMCPEYRHVLCLGCGNGSNKCYIFTLHHKDVPVRLRLHKRLDQNENKSKFGDFPKTWIIDAILYSQAL